VAQETKVYGRYCDLLRKIGKLAEERVGRRLPVNVTGAIGAISMDMGLPWQMSKSFAILGRALGGIAHVGEEVRPSHRPRHFKSDSRQFCNTSRRSNWISKQLTFA